MAGSLLELDQFIQVAGPCSSLSIPGKADLLKQLDAFGSNAAHLSINKQLILFALNEEDVR